MHMRGIKRFRNNRFFQRGPRTTLSTRECLAAIKECYEIHLSEKDQANYNMIPRYENKVSDRLLETKKCLYSKGKEAAKDFMKSLVYSGNPFLATLPKEQGFVGKYIPVPIKYDGR